MGRREGVAMGVGHKIILRAATPRRDRWYDVLRDTWHETWRETWHGTWCDTPCHKPTKGWP